VKIDRRVPQFSPLVELPCDVNADDISARKLHILTLTMPKSEEGSTTNRGQGKLIA
jgi:hypothetical protein